MDEVGIRDRIDRCFEAWGHTAFRHPRSLIFAMLAVTVGFCAGLGALSINASLENLLKRDDPTRVAYDRFRNQFSNDDTTVLVIHSQNIFSFAFLETLRDLHRDLEEELPALDSVTSLVNARVTRGDGDELIVEDLLERWPSDEEELRTIARRAGANPAYRNTLLSEDGYYTAVTIETTPGSFGAEGGAPGRSQQDLEEFRNAERAGREEVVLEAKLMQNEELGAFVETLASIVSRYNSGDFEVHQAGAAPITYAVLTALSADMRLFSALSNALIFLLLYLLLRRLSAVFLALLVVTPAVAGTFGFMGFAGLPITATSQILPSMLLAVCVGDSVHILSIFYREFDRGTDTETAVAFALRHSGLAVVMTSLTTAGGLGSFAFADLGPLVGLGLAAPVGIMLALIYSLVLLPALIAVFPLARRPQAPSGQTTAHLDRTLAAIGEFSTRHPGIVVMTWALFTLLSLHSALRLECSYAAHKWFPKDFHIRTAMETANKAMKGVIPLEVILDTGTENGVYDPHLMNRMDALRATAEAMTIDTVRAGKAISILDVLKEIHQSLNGNNPAHYAIPQSRELIAQELLLFESSGSDDVDRFVDAAFRRTRMTLLIPYEDGLHYLPYVRQARRMFREMMGGIAEVEVTGLTVVYARTVSAILRSTARSYIIALIVITPLLILLIGHLRLGFVSLIPNLAPVIIGMGLMYWARLKLDVFTIMIGSIVIGVAVDDTIHFMYNFRRYYGETGDVPLAVRRTLLSTGRAIVITSIALCIGFIVFLLATMENVRSFGVVTSVCIVVAALADLSFCPALVALVARFSKLRVSSVIVSPLTLRRHMEPWSGKQGEIAAGIRYSRAGKVLDSQTTREVGGSGP